METNLFRTFYQPQEYAGIEGWVPPGDVLHHMTLLVFFQLGVASFVQTHPPALGRVRLRTPRRSEGNRHPLPRHGPNL